MGHPFFNALDAFGFTQMQSWIVLVCLLVFLGNFLGGMLYSISRAYLGAITPRKLSERISFRLFLLSELFLVVFIVYYHGALIGYVYPGHILFWISAMIIAPLLAIIGSQAMYLLLSKQINKNIQTGKKRRSTSRATPAAEAKNSPPEDFKNPAKDFLRGKRTPR
ncbi:hypothetical protein [Varunaivibrio sulfuroxidans]|uniref:Uncharacterized protein n=1 Tax=Varunaivibrio sulfuroxidans TaxID=1773489 RepID=A0A4V2UN26_9PROT|nr:hypothetical protein [Varunaivibrio sulfuroxidans]TCS60381.1 hypothetical protein EDD55_11182 [Varunaivibrio sulfuroxidans]WES30932.1 hypothetical protein P3M64_00725 [Varunaivibrio sulfuroxidans]